MDILYTGQQKGAYAPEVKKLGSRMFGCLLRYDQLRFIYNFYKFLKKEKYDAVNSHLADMGGGAILSAWLAGVPIRVSSYHTSLGDKGFLRNLYLRIMRHIILKFSTDITTSSPGVSESHFKNFKVTENKIHAISYGVDTESFLLETDNKIDLTKFGFDKDNLVVGHVGSYRPQKNHETLLKIAKKVVADLPNVRFLLCGAACSSPNVTGSYKDMVDDMIKDMGLSKYIAQVHGLDDMRQFYNSIDIFVLPSRHEGMPISLIEAQAAAKPIVATKINGIVLATEPQMQSNLFEIDDVEPFAECVIDLLKNKEKRLKLGKDGREFVKKELDIKISAEKYIGLYICD
jgi:glycosyltransferase involved in cell wall biosynthesis